MILNQHLTRFAGERCAPPPEFSFYAVEYGALRSVYASTACNYSYREFWF